MIKLNKNVIRFPSLLDWGGYVFQDVKWYYNINRIHKIIIRCYLNASFLFCILFRFAGRCKWVGVIYKRFCRKMNIDVPVDLKIGEGMIFPHGFPLVINGSSVIGRFVTINPNVLIGGDRKVGKSPVIGDCCYIGNGVKIIGNVSIGKWCFMAPGAVITKDIPEGSVVGFGLNNIISQNGKQRVIEYMSNKVKNKTLEDERNNRY